jgi:hypothetical protein
MFRLFFLGICVKGWFVRSMLCVSLVLPHIIRMYGRGGVSRLQRDLLRINVILLRVKYGWYTSCNTIDIRYLTTVRLANPRPFIWKTTVIRVLWSAVPRDGMSGYHMVTLAIIDIGGQCDIRGPCHLEDLCSINDWIKELGYRSVVMVLVCTRLIILFDMLSAILVVQRECDNSINYIL